MTTNWIVYACLVVGLSSALVAGVFQAFSDFVMKGLLAAKPTAGVESMQMINRTVMRSTFLAMFLILAPITIGLAAYAYFKLSGAAQGWMIPGAMIYVGGVFLVTVLGNVPMNNRLAEMDHTRSEAADYWRTYGTVWTNLNHVRTFGSAVAAACFLLAGVALA